MRFPEVKYCPGTLAEGFNTYSPGCLRNMFNGKKVYHILPYEPPQQSEEVAALFMDNRKRISISGVQEKLSFMLDKNLLRLTRPGERGTYILKPIPVNLKNVDQVPANEHLTMQIARQVYGLNTAENALVFFKNGSPAYLTKRFDIKATGGKWRKEDFASLAGKTKDNAGDNFKYEGSYEEIGLLIRRFVPAWRVEIEKFFVLVVFNYLLLSPAYDLINTRLHVDDSDFALDNGLFADGYKSRQYKKAGHPNLTDFTELAKRIEVTESRVKILLQPFLEKQNLVEILINRSYLNDKCKRAYILMFNTKRNYLTT
jgi:serine/threonine-protein kinase HipA